ncbi:methylenetetrahydrofolate reductase [Thermoanaerobacterium sp. RBIITD]|uniref:methylenetetrahydrofolate reductase n=1 Tax=Thermoanaerobacterium sp. RBIITD TaxID=1550240 RepID=UPI000BB9B003|nr:methylenetetrahydrofolate reductase [Thermoanaerobacterium sp. RBIITD]
MFKDESLCNKLNRGEFIITAEISTPKGADITKTIEEARKLKGIVDALNITDCPMANMRMSPIALAHLLQNHLNIETIFHLTCRDRNLIGLQSELLGAYALGVRNVLALTGDDPSRGDTPTATGVYDVDSIGLLKIVNSLNNGYDYSGNKLESSTEFCIGTTANPNDLTEKAIDKLKSKIDAGVAFIQTQPVYDEDILFKFIKKIEALNIPVLVGVLPLKSYKMAVNLNKKVPGIDVPEHIIEKLKIKGKEEGINIAVEFIKNIRNNVGGIHVMPLGKVDVVADIASRIDNMEFKLSEKKVETN